MKRLRARLRRLLVPVADGLDVVPEAPPVPIREIFRRFWPDARPYRLAIAAGAVFLVLVPAIEAVEIWLFKLVVDDVLVPRDVAALLPLAGAYLGLTVLSGLVRFGDDYLATWVGERFLLNLRARVFAHVQGLSLDVLDRRRLGDVLSRLTSDIHAIERFVLTGVGDGISAIARIVFFTGALMILSWRLALVSLVVVPLFWLVARRFSKLIKHASREKRRRSGSLNAVAEESLANAALVQSMGREAHELERFKRENAAIMEAELASTRIRALFSPLVDLIELLGAMVVVGLGVWALSSGDLTIGGLLVFLAYLSQLYGPVRELSGLVNSLYAASAGAERVIELLEERPGVVERVDARPLPAPGAALRGHVELREVTYRYPGSSRPALEDCSLVVEPGECVALSGPSGAGKTTATRLLLRFADPDAGAVLVDGEDLREVRLRDVRAQLGLLAQETLLFEGTVRDNIGYGRPEASAEEIERVASAVGIAELLDARVGQRGRALSGGQRQRVAIARAIVRDSAVVVLDEPTTGLDADAREEVLGALDALLPGRTTIVVSHDPAVVQRADRVIELLAPEGGQPAAGSPAAGSSAAARPDAALDAPSTDARDAASADAEALA